MSEGEYPTNTARREARKELGLDIEIGPLLAIDWVPPQPDGRPALVNFVFDAGPLSHQQTRTLRLQDGELQAWRLCTAAERDTLLAPPMARRVHAAIQARHRGHTAYLHQGWPPSPPTS